MLSSYIFIKSAVGLTALWNEDDAFMVNLCILSTKTDIYARLIPFLPIDKQQKQYFINELVNIRTVAKQMVIVVILYHFCFLTDRIRFEVQKSDLWPLRRLQRCPRLQ